MNNQKSYRKYVGNLLGKQLPSDIIIHHIDSNRKNNNPDNLMLFASQGDHLRYHHGKGEPGLTTSEIEFILEREADTPYGVNPMGAFIPYNNMFPV